MSRCYACCQENCGYTRCSCDCHGDVAVKSSGFLTMGGSPYPNTNDAPASDPHSYPGVQNKQTLRWDLEREQDLRAYGHVNLPTCKKHRRYMGLRRPRTACEGCWRRWIALNPT